MKNKQKNLILGIILFLFCGACAHYTDNTYATLIYRYVNESGVEVALVGDINDNFDIPDSLVLQNGESFECSNSYSPLDMSGSPQFPYNLGDLDALPVVYFPIKVYFNQTIKLVYYANKPNYDLRNPFFRDEDSSYIKTTREVKHKKDIEIINTYTYTFTAEDYQNALKVQE